MFFRNLTFLRFPVELSFDDFGDGLDECQLKPVGPLELSSRGFVPPFGRDSELLAATQPSAIWLTVGGEDRMLPGAVVNAELQKKLEAIEQREGRRPGGRTRKRIKDELITDLLPRPFVKPSRVDALLLRDLGVLAVDTSSRKVAENVASEIRRALGSFPALPLNAEVAPRSVLTSWVAGESLPEGLAIGEECELRDAIDQGAIAKLSRTEVVGNAEVDKHLQAGKQCTRLALTLDDHVSFVLGEDLTVRKFKLLDGAIDQLEAMDTDDMHAELDARFALMAGELRRLFTVLEGALKLSKVEA